MSVLRDYLPNVKLGQWTDRRLGSVTLGLEHIRSFWSSEPGFNQLLTMSHTPRISAQLVIGEPSVTVPDALTFRETRIFVPCGRVIGRKETQQKPLLE